MRDGARAGVSGGSGSAVAGNGRIDNIAEMFGGRGLSGFGELATHDSDGDGRFAGGRANPKVTQKLHQGTAEMRGSGKMSRCAAACNDNDAWSGRPFIECYVDAVLREVA